MTLTVTDVTGTSVSRTLAPFTVTDSGQPHLDVSGLAPLPATMNVGDAFSSQMQVSGASNSPNGAVGAAFTGLPGGDSAYAFQMTSGADPVGMSAILIVNSPGPRDVYIQLTDYNDGTRQKLVHWGTTNVVAAPLQAVSQFPSQVTGTGGTTQTVYARFKGYYNNATPAVSQPASLNASPSIQGCNNYTPCDPASGGQNGESIVALSVTFPPPGTYSGVRVSVSTDRGEKIFFDPFDVVSTPPQPLRIVKQFDTPIKLQSSPYGGVYMDEVYGVFSGGSPATSASVSTNSMDLSNLYVTVKNCTDWSYLCNQLGVDPSNALVSMSGYLYNAGHYPGIVVSLSDPALTQGASFDPVTIDIAPPPLSNCAFKPLSAMSASDNTVPSAVTFTGGVAPYSVTASSDAVSFGPDTGSGIGHAFDGKVASNAAATSVHVSVADAAGGTCSGDVDLSNYQFVSGPGLDVAVVNQATNPYGNVTSYLVTQSATNDITAQMNDPANGPLGAHPDWNGVVLQFVTPGGQSVQGYSLASSQSPITHALYGPGPVQESYGAGYPPTPGYLYTQNLQNLEDYQLPASDYTYRYYVFLSDGTYRLSSPFTTHVLTWTYPGQ